MEKYQPVLHRDIPHMLGNKIIGYTTAADLHMVSSKAWRDSAKKVTGELRTEFIRRSNIHRDLAKVARKSSAHKVALAARKNVRARNKRATRKQPLKRVRA